jgi:hypothetical protein
MEERDFTGNNFVVALLEERRQLKKMFDAFDQGRQRWKEINDVLKELMGEAKVATLPGWRLEVKLQNRKERVVPAETRKLLYVKRDDDDDEF